MMNVKVGESFVAKAANGKQVRCKREDQDAFFVFAPKKRRYGWRYTEAEFEKLFVIEPPKKTPTEEWHARLNRAIKCMHYSGLWPNIMMRFKNCLLMTAEDHQVMKEVYWDRHRLVNGKYVERTQDEMDAMWQPFYAKYPFAFFKGTDGHLHADSDYLFDVSDCRLKSMYFGKRENKDIKIELQCAIEDRRPWSQSRIRTSYDVSVEYDPGKQKAWYSEEYKNCGNGHYYLMLDHSTALFCEDD